MFVSSTLYYELYNKYQVISNLTILVKNYLTHVKVYMNNTKVINNLNFKQLSLNEIHILKKLCCKIKKLNL